MSRRFLIACAALSLAGVPAMAQSRSADADAGQQPPIQARPGGPESNPRTDQTVDVTKGTRLVLSNNAGEVVVRSWDRDQVRVQATHSDRERLDIQRLRELPVDPVADPAQPCEVAQVLRLGVTAGHLRDRTSRGDHPAGRGASFHLAGNRRGVRHRTMSGCCSLRT